MIGREIILCSPIFTFLSKFWFEITDFVEILKNVAKVLKASVFGAEIFANFVWSIDESFGAATLI